uniref:Uncharacterized protein n=1 Tax=Meloidogyne enterolobii TaxID=390850 RepID=A0A6V7XT04_MELEN|nr:unnamed protein product [Meloidogyne enterolobii]
MNSPFSLSFVLLLLQIFYFILVFGMTSKSVDILFEFKCDENCYKLLVRDYHILSPQMILQLRLYFIKYSFACSCSSIISSSSV